jgi:hypothetical protein
MGLFKGLRDMKDMVEGAPAQIAAAQQAGAAAQAYGATAQAAGMGGMPGTAPMNPNDPAMAPIEGIDINRYAQLSKAIGHFQLKTSEQIDQYMTSQGVTPEAWQAAYDGWTERMKGNMQLAVQYGQLYNTAQV